MNSLLEAVRDVEAKYDFKIWTIKIKRLTWENLCKLEDPEQLVFRPWDQSALIEPLNDRELTVLRQISGGCSNREIGEQMFLSVNTVRWYASQIYMKLGVKNRTEAVAKAREIGIL